LEVIHPGIILASEVQVAIRVQLRQQVGAAAGKSRQVEREDLAAGVIAPVVGIQARRGIA
jgi:hypothetical protein